MKFYAWVVLLLTVVNIGVLYINHYMITRINVHTLEFVEDLHSEFSREVLKDTYGIPTPEDLEKIGEAWSEKYAPLIEVDSELLGE